MLFTSLWTEACPGTSFESLPRKQQEVTAPSPPGWRRSHAEEAARGEMVSVGQARRRPEKPVLWAGALTPRAVLGPVRGRQSRPAPHLPVAAVHTHLPGEPSLAGFPRFQVPGEKMRGACGRTKPALRGNGLRQVTATQLRSAAGSSDGQLRGTRASHAPCSPGATARGCTSSSH